MKDENEIVFRVNYTPNVEPFISVNGHWISRPHFTSNIGDFFSYIHKNSNRRITKEEVLAQNIELKKGMDDILRDLGFRGILARVFFKEMTNSAVYFVNPVSLKDLKELKIEDIEVYRLMYTPKRKTAILPTD
jgi:hypothetical protein